MPSQMVAFFLHWLHANELAAFLRLLYNAIEYERVSDTRIELVFRATLFKNKVQEGVWWHPPLTPPAPPPSRVPMLPPALPVGTCVQAKGQHAVGPH